MDLQASIFLGRLHVGYTFFYVGDMSVAFRTVLMFILDFLSCPRNVLEIESRSAFCH